MVTGIDRVGLIIAAILFLFGLYVMNIRYNELYPKPKYNVGDCYSSKSEDGEFLPGKISPFFNEVLEVGKENYLVQEYYRYASGEISKEIIVEESFIVANKGTIKVDCKTGLIKKPEINIEVKVKSE